MSIFSRVFGRFRRPEASLPEPKAPVASNSPYKNVVDLRSDEEREIERKANAGKSLGGEADLMVNELIQIGRGVGYISTQRTGEFNEEGDHRRTREIGERLDEIGGLNLMVAANYKVRAALGGGAARALEHAWGNIGEWQS